MEDTTGRALLDSTSFRLGLIGAQVTQVFTSRIEKLGASHKQIGLLALVDAGYASSQRGIADALGVAPSLVVTLVDQLVKMGAVNRVRDTTDRRVQLLELTPGGKQLLARGIRVVSELDHELTGMLTSAAAEGFTSGLQQFIGDDGLPSRIPREIPR